MSGVPTIAESSASHDTPQAEAPYGRRSSRPRPEPRSFEPYGPYGPFVPLAIFFAAALVWSVFQFYQLRLEHGTLTTLRANQDTLFGQSQKVRSTLDALATQTKRLADGGNANAKLVIDELRKRGITINTRDPSRPNQ
jgi:hypothetical protein